MEDLYLIYVHGIGFDHEDINYYEFIFGDSKENLESEEEWDSYPASGNPSPPSVDLIKEVGKIGIEGELVLAQNNELFSMWDAIDKVIPLAWESIDGLLEYPENRLVFHFGMTLSEVREVLYGRDIRIKFKNKLKDEKK